MNAAVADVAVQPAATLMPIMENICSGASEKLVTRSKFKRMSL